MRRALTAELFGTFSLVFCGTGAVVINQISEGAITHVGISLVFGLIVLALIYALGDISGAHINPAVTLAFCVAGRFPAAKVVPYVLTQVIGAVAASVALRMMFGNVAGLGGTHPFQQQGMQSLMLEFFLTLLLMAVVLCVSTGAKEKGITAGIAVGSIIALEALFAGPICGASMNPARSFGPAVISGQGIDELWIYFLGPIAGALCAVPLARILHPEPPAAT